MEPTKEAKAAVSSSAVLVPKSAPVKIKEEPTATMETLLKRIMETPNIMLEVTQQRETRRKIAKAEADQQELLLSSIKDI